jgi:hypothetical protein
MNYLSQPITGFYYQTSQLFSGRVSFQSASVAGRTQQQSQPCGKPRTLCEILLNLANPNSHTIIGLSFSGWTDTA